MKHKKDIKYSETLKAYYIKKDKIMYVLDEILDRELFFLKKNSIEIIIKNYDEI